MTNRPETVVRPRPLIAALLGLALLTTLFGAAPAGAVPFAPDIKGGIGYDVSGGTGYHRLIWGHPGDGTGGGAVDAWQVQRWNAAETVVLQTYDVAVAQGPDITITGMADEVVQKYRVRAHNAEGWSAWSGFEALKVNSGLFHWAPYPNEAAIVRAHYRNFLDRLPTTGESSTATSQIQGAGSLVTFMNGLIDRTARTKHRHPVIRLYLAYFDRAPEPGGLDYWVGRLSSGSASLSSVSSFFAGSAEFKALYGGTTNQQFVTLVYQNVLDRNPGPNEVAYWKGQLDQKKTSRGKVMIGFSESAEGKALRRGETVVADVWVAMMDTRPSNAILQTYGDHVRAGGTGGDIGLFLQHLLDYPTD